MRRIHGRRRQAAQYVAAGATYLFLSTALFWLWLTVDNVLILLLALSTVVAGLVDLSVGWPRLRRTHWHARSR